MEEKQLPVAYITVQDLPTDKVEQNMMKKSIRTTRASFRVNSIIILCKHQS